MFFDFEQHKYLYLIQKQSKGSSTFEVWNKKVFSFVPEMFFLQSRQVNVSSYTCVW